MKKLLVLLGCAVLLFSGCQNYGRSKSGVEVIIEGGGQFPQSLAGKWKAGRNEWERWEVVFRPNGVVSSAVTPLTDEVRPNQTTRMQGRKGEPGFFEAGNFQVYYNPQFRELSVDIKIKQVYLDMGSIAKGPCEYLIIGNISENGKTWDGNVYTFLDLAVLVPDPNNRSIWGKPKYKNIGPLYADFATEEPQSLTFTKVEMASSIPDGNAANNK
ncbi:MAG: hypothetical protein MUP16_00210 [Sedimentisphaerales bacterium]|nr:hypothetical protein [Sedimentisphaerales bacterium]